ncbi:unnamed protein product [Closterium sp. Naga37s-1]|nr:unnamed protein product [Closterium sp. Naga37s-1]
MPFSPPPLSTLPPPSPPFPPFLPRHLRLLQDGWSSLRRGPPSMNTRGSLGISHALPLAPTAPTLPAYPLFPSCLPLSSPAPPASPIPSAQAAAGWAAAGRVEQPAARCAQHEHSRQPGGCLVLCCQRCRCCRAKAGEMIEPCHAKAGKFTKHIERNLTLLCSLVSLGAVSSFVVSAVAAAVPKLGWPAFFEEPLMLLAFVLLGKALEELLGILKSDSLFSPLSPSFVPHSPPGLAGVLRGAAHAAGVRAAGEGTRRAG